MRTRELVGMMALVAGMASSCLAQEAKPAAATPPAPAAGAPAAPKPEPKPEPTLKAGMAAPEFKVEKFIKGTPFTGLEKGQIYVMEFWATWCGPCIASMPHISELQREYKDKGVTIVGVNVWEDKELNAATLEKATKFVEKKGTGMDYTVVFDGAAKHMDTEWMKAAGRNGIPCAFVVDREGKIAWIGHPMSMDMVLDEVVAGKWDVTKGPERITAAQTAFSDAGKKYKDSVAAGNEAWEQANKDFPVLGRTMKARQFGALLTAGHTKEACELGTKLLEQAAAKKDAGGITGVLQGLGDPASLKTQEAKDLLVKAAEANFELADKTESAPHITLARAYYFTGQTEKGDAAAAKALELAPEDVRPRMDTWLKDLKEKAKAATEAK